MSTTNNPLYGEPIRRTLTHHAGDSPDSRAVAEATLIIWNLVSNRLAPVIGTKGVDVLFRRSLHLAAAVFPLFSIPGAQADNTSLFENIKGRLADQKIAAAMEAGCTLLITLTELLTTLIGESLTERLLGTVWVSPSHSSKQENVS